MRVVPVALCLLGPTGPAQASDGGRDAAGTHVAAATGARRSNWPHSHEIALD